MPTFEEIKAKCIAEKRLFEDPDFPAVDKSLYFDLPPSKPFVWKRPPELVKDPQFIVGGESRSDVCQGGLGDCWFLASVASLTQHPNLLEKVVPSDQSFTDGYAGIFRFNFWQYGKWTEVIIDDRLPTQNDKLMYVRSGTKNEFWSALLEKAYAKLNGCYQDLKGGTATEAMEDFTSGISEIISLALQKPSEIFDIMSKAFQRNALMASGIAADPAITENVLPNGLVMGHCYSVTDVQQVERDVGSKKENVHLVRIRNPWGSSTEWKGAWSDQSPEWLTVSQAEQKRIGLARAADGEFWISINDYLLNYQTLQICYLGPDSMTDDSPSKVTWEVTSLEGSWKKGVNAGGCPNNLVSFATNPQYHVEIVDLDLSAQDKRGTLIVGLMQKGGRIKRMQHLGNLAIGYEIYKIKDNSVGRLGVDFFKHNKTVAEQSYGKIREAVGRYKLAPGTYCIVPATFEPNQEADYLLRFFTEKPVKVVSPK